MIARRTTLAGLGLAGVGLAGPGSALLAPRRADATRFVTMMTAAPAGTNGDEIARLFARTLRRVLDGPEIQVRNVPGDGGWTALKALADAPPSGSTIGWVGTPVLPARTVDRSDPKLPSRLTLLGSVEREPVAFVGSADDPLESVRDMIERAGLDLGGRPLGTPPPGSPSHLAVLRLQVLTQTRLNIIPFPSAAAARQALLGGNVTAAALGLSDVVAALRDGTLVGLGIAAEQRTDILPDLPVLSEAGVAFSAWIRRGLAVPSETPAEVIVPLIAAARAVADDPDFHEQAQTLGILPAWTEGADWKAQVTREVGDLRDLWAADPWLNATGQ